MIGDTLRVWADKFLGFFLMFLLLGLVTAGIGLALSVIVPGYASSSPSVLPFPGGTPGTISLVGLLVGSVAAGFLGAVAQAFFTAAGTYVAFRTHRQSPVTIGQGFAEGVNRFFSVLGAGLVVALITVGLFIVPEILLFTGLLGLDLVLIALGVLLFIALLPIVIFLYLSFAIYAPVIVLEGSRAIDGLAQSWRYMRGRRLSFFGAVIVIGLLAGAITLALVFIPSVLQLAGGTIASVLALYVAMIVATGITGSLSVILASVTYSLIRFDEDVKRQYPGWYGMPGPPPAAPVSPAGPVYAPASPPPAQPPAGPPPPSGP